MKSYLIGLALLASTSMSFAATGLEFIQDLVGDHELSCGTVNIELRDNDSEYASLWIKFPQRTFIVTLRADGKENDVKVSGQTLKFTHEETDNAWPNLKDWEKEEVKITKDKNGELSSISFRVGWGKPLYISSVRKQSCTK